MHIHRSTFVVVLVFTAQICFIVGALPYKIPANFTSIGLFFLTWAFVASGVL